MTAITTANLQHNNLFFDFEQFTRQQLETQESEMREELQAREAEERWLKAQKSISEKMIEELRPLCEELPSCALDPVTYEPLEEAMVTQCSHTFNRSSLVNAAESMGGMQEIKKMKGMPCPVCRWKFSPGPGLFPCGSVRDMVEIFKQISEVFKRNVTSSA